MIPKLKCLLALAVVLLAVNTGLAQPEPDASYKLRQMDLISVQVFNEADLSKQTRIDGSGRIRMGLIGTIEIAGLTLSEAEDLLEKTFLDERFLRDPQISIEVLQYAPLYVHVFGEVNRPGRIQLEGEQLSVPILDLISAAGGFTGLAKSDSVRITRTSTSGEEKVIEINLQSLIDGKKADIPEEFKNLLPDDVVFVPVRLF